MLKHKVNFTTTDKRLTYFFLIVLLCTPLRLTAQCGPLSDLLMKYGIYNTTDTKWTQGTISSFVNWFRQNNFSTYEDAESTSTKLGIPIGNVFVGFGLTDNKDNWGEFKQDIEQYASGQYAQKDSFENHMHNIDNDAIKSLADCLNSDGVHVWFEPGANVNEFWIVAKYIGIHDAHVKSVSIPSNIEIDKSTQDVFEPSGWWIFKSYFPLTSNESRAKYIRKDSNAISIGFSTDEGGDNIINIPPIPGPAQIQYSSPEKMENGTYEEGAALLLGNPPVCNCSWDLSNIRHNVPWSIVRRGGLQDPTCLCPVELCSGITADDTCDALHVSKHIFINYQIGGMNFVQHQQTGSSIAPAWFSSMKVPLCAPTKKWVLSGTFEGSTGGTDKALVLDRPGAVGNHTKDAALTIFSSRLNPNTIQTFFPFDLANHFMTVLDDVKPGSYDISLESPLLCRAPTENHEQGDAKGTIDFNLTLTLVDR
jgi:hypothetical protein